MKLIEFSLIIFLSLFAFLISFYFGHQGLMPLDDLQNFNSGYRVLIGDFPFVDYFSVTGPILDIWQANLYKIFGLNWQIFVSHAAIMNCLYSLSIFIFLKKFDFKLEERFFYSISAGLLMYPTAGNPTVEHNSLILSVVATFFFIVALKDKNKLFLFVSTFIFFISFFTKQVPTAYFVILCIVIYFFEIFSKISLINFSVIFISLISTTLLFVFYFLINDVPIENIFNQYFILSINLGENRFSGTNFSHMYENISKIFFLLFLLIPSFYLSFITKNFNNFILILGLSLISIVYEIHSNNQPITFSLLPIFLSLFYYYYQKENINSNFIKYFFCLIIFYAFYRILRFETYYIFIFLILIIYLFYKKKTNFSFIILIYLFIVSCFYFEKYIKIRAWDDLKKHDLDDSFDAVIIDEKLENLKWKTVYFNQTSNEKKMILGTLNYLKNIDDDINFILISDYQIYNLILNKRDFSPVKYWFKNATYPPQNHPLRSNFENFFKSKLINNNVGQLIIDNTGKFKSNELSEFNWLYKCLTKDNSIYVAKNVDIFFIKNNCIK